MTYCPIFLASLSSYSKLLSWDVRQLPSRGTLVVFLISRRASYSLSFALAESKVKAHIFCLLLIHTAALSQVGRVGPLPVLSWTGRRHRETAITGACQNHAGHLEGVGHCLRTKHCGSCLLRSLKRRVWEHKKAPQEGVLADTCVRGARG